VDEAFEQRENPWDPARLEREWVRQTLNDIQQQMAGIRAEASAAVVASAAVRLAEVLRTNGVPSVGWKKADRALRALDVTTSKATYYRARRINERRL
jgi:hypothetical protein